MKYKVYVIDSKGYYAGKSLVAAESVEEANKIIDAFVKDDPHNYADSWGYCHVDEYEAIDGIYSEQKGIIYQGIYYSG